MKSIFTYLRNVLIVCLIFVGGIQTATAQINKNYIYGKVFAKDSSVFEGYIQFGDRSFMWGDYFYLDKIENPYCEIVPENKRIIRSTKVQDDKGSVRILNRNLNNLSTHEFVVRFGYLNSIEFLSQRYVTLEVKEGKFINVKTSYSHSSLDVKVNDRELGEITLDASQISKIEFIPSPDITEDVISSPLYGTVLTKQGEFTGFIWWDNDEHNENGLLDGNWGKKDVSIYFKNIQAIEKYDRCCNVTTVSGKTVRLCGSNDVNYGNRGIYVNMPNVGLVKIKWSDFESVEFIHSLNNVGLSYNDYMQVERIRGKVKTKDGHEVEGILVYDLDEAMNIENLDGKNGGLDYKIPFMYIKRVIPKSYKYSQVELKNGTKLFLGKSSDVDYKNDGVIIFKSSTEIEYYHWHEIREIIIQ